MVRLLVLSCRLLTAEGAGDGLLDLKEFAAGLKKLTGDKLTQSQTELAFRGLDIDADGVLDIHEFTTAIQKVVLHAMPVVSNSLAAHSGSRTNGQESRPSKANQTGNNKEAACKASSSAQAIEASRQRRAAARRT